MAQAKRDENSVPTLIGVSNADGTTPTLVYVDATTHRLLVDLNVSTGTSSPSSTPSVVGSMYVDTSGKKIYVATGTSSSSDWTIVN